MGLNSTGNLYPLTLFEFRIPVQIIAPAFMQVIRREGTAIFLQFMAQRPPRSLARIHAALLGQTAAFAHIAAAAGGNDIFPYGAAAL